MQYRQLGKTSLQVSEVALGTWLNLGLKLTGVEAENYVKVAIDAGVNLIDTAEAYEGGDAELILGDVFQSLAVSRDSFCVCTKLFHGAIRRADREKRLPTQHGLSRKHLVEGCDQSLRRLRLDHIDILLCHRYDAYASVEEISWTMHSLTLQGKILYWGTSEWPPQKILELKSFCLANNLIGPKIEQPQYNVLHQQSVDHLLDPEFSLDELGLLTWSPLASGLLSGRYSNVDAPGRLNDPATSWVRQLAYGEYPSDTALTIASAIVSLAGELNMTPAQFSIAWCLANSRVSSVVLGGSSVEQLTENIGSILLQKQLNSAILSKVRDLLDESTMSRQCNKRAN